MTIRPNKVALSVVLALSMAAATNQALAQQTAAPAANTAAEEDIEVISISRKRPESIQEVPIATTALSEKDIESAGIVRTGDFISLIPNVSIVDAANIGAAVLGKLLGG